MVSHSILSIMKELLCQYSNDSHLGEGRHGGRAESRHREVKRREFPTVRSMVIPLRLCGRPVIFKSCDRTLRHVIV